MSDSWFEMLDRAKANGRQYAENGIAGGDRQPEDSPLSGEWAGAILPKDVVSELGGDIDTLEEWEREDILNHWEDGYLSADWPEHLDDDDDGPAIDSEDVGPLVMIDDEGNIETIIE